MSRLFMSEKVCNALNGGDKRSTAVKRNIIGSLAIKGGNILVQLLLVPLTLGYLNDDLYGVWLTVSSMIMWLGYFDIGLTAGLRNRLVEALAHDDYERGQKLVSTSYALLALIFIPLCAVGIALIPHVDWCAMLNIDAAYSQELVVVMDILLSAFALQMIFSTLTSILAAYQRVALSSIFTFLGNGLSLVVILILRCFTHGSLELMAVFVSYLPVLVLLVSSIFFFNGSLRRVSPKLSKIDFSLSKDVFSLGVKFFIIQIQLLVVYQSTNFLISYITSPVEVTSYNVTFRYINTAAMILYVIISPLCPAFTDAYTRNDYAWMRNVYHKMSFLFCGTLALIVLMALASPFVYQIWVGDSNISSWAMTIAVAVYVSVYSWVSIHAVLINGIGALTLETVVTLCGMLAMVPLSLLLGKYMGMGAYGVIGAMTAINAVYCVFFTVQIKKILSGNCSGIWLK